MYEKTPKIWLDGKFVRWEDANVHVLTHTLHYGVGAFEGIRYYDCGQKGPAVFRLREHVRRLAETCKICAMKLSYSQDEVFEACLETVRVNGRTNGYLRPLAFISDGPGAGVWAYENPVRLTIITFGWGAYLGEEGKKNGIRTKIASLVRHHRNAGMMKGKICGQYVNSVLAKREAKIAGYDEALMLDPEGFMAEGTGENLFMVRDGVVRTPTLRSILRGITRDTAMTLLKEDGYEVLEAPITRDDLYVADEVFLTGTAAEITPIREIDNRSIGDGTPGPITRKLSTIYDDLVHGRSERHREWLTFAEKR